MSVPREPKAGDKVTVYTACERTYDGTVVFALGKNRIVVSCPPTQITSHNHPPIEVGVKYAVCRREHCGGNASLFLLRHSYATMEAAIAHIEEPGAFEDILRWCA